MSSLAKITGYFSIPYCCRSFTSQRNRHLGNITKSITNIPLHGTSASRFKLKPGDVFKVNAEGLYIADPLSAIGYATGSTTSCRRIADKADTSLPVIVRVASIKDQALLDKKLGLSKTELGYSAIGSGWWYIRPDTELKVIEMYTINKTSEKIIPYLPDLWPDKKVLNLEELPDIRTELAKLKQKADNLGY